MIEPLAGHTWIRGKGVVLSRNPDLILLDLHLPDKHGLEVLREIREESTVPIIVVTATGDEEAAVVRSLELGADDYVTKPFRSMELVARVRAVLKRTRAKGSGTPRPAYIHGDCRFDFNVLRAERLGCEIQLTPLQTRLLAYLAERCGSVVKATEVLTEVWGPEYRDDVLLLRVAISRLRSKIDDPEGRDSLITTRPGIGYMLAAPRSRSAPRAGAEAQ